MIKENSSRNFRVVFYDDREIFTKLKIASKVNPEDAGEIYPSFIDLIVDENDCEIFEDEIKFVELL